MTQEEDRPNLYEARSWLGLTALELGKRAGEIADTMSRNPSPVVIKAAIESARQSALKALDMLSRADAEINRGDQS